MAQMSTRRKLAIATWNAASEGTIFGKLTIDATQTLAYIEHLKATTGEKVSVTHLVGKAVAMAMAQAPDLNGRIVFGRFEPFQSVDVTYLVALEGGKDLAKVKIENLDRRPVTEVAQELRRRSEKLRSGQDEEFEKSKGLLRALPTWLLRPILFFIGWLTAAVGVSVKGLGLEAFPFGSCIVTSVGMFGIEEAFAPFTPFARVPVLLLVGAVTDRPAVADGKLVIRPQFTLTATLDHRFIDGQQIAVIGKVVRSVLEDPWQLEQKPAEAAEAAA